eukprot:scaffold98718_cov63-Phaeocystis_antarctica.AAC.5
MAEAIAREARGEPPQSAYLTMLDRLRSDPATGSKQQLQQQARPAPPRPAPPRRAAPRRAALPCTAPPRPTPRLASPGAASEDPAQRARRCVGGEAPPALVGVRAPRWRLQSERHRHRPSAARPVAHRRAGRAAAGAARAAGAAGAAGADERWRSGACLGAAVAHVRAA